MTQHCLNQLNYVFGVEWELSSMPRIVEFALPDKSDAGISSFINRKVDIMEPIARLDTLMEERREESGYTDGFFQISLNYVTIATFILRAFVNLTGGKLTPGFSLFESRSSALLNAVESAKTIYLNSKIQTQPTGSVDISPPAPTSVEDLLSELNSLIGLSDVKSEVSSLVNFIKIRELRKGKGMVVPNVSLHLVFTGNPGTGKTTVARIVAKIYHALGILTRDHLTEVDRSGLVAGYVGQTALKVKDVIEKSKNGVLFIDEAYTLSSSGGNDYGKEAIEILLKEMEDHRDNLIIIVAGYTAPMQEFLEINPGLKSRFNRFISFSDYDNIQLYEIFVKMVTEAGYNIDSACVPQVELLLEKIIAEKGINFANAREVRNIFEYCISRQADRLAAQQSISDDELNLITRADLPPLAQTLTVS